MPSTATVSSELDAINTMLATIGEAPINTLVGALPADVAVARNTLVEVVREVQLEGWAFNTVKDKVFQPDAEGRIFVAPSVFRVTLEDPDSRDLVLRGNRLYDRANQTYTFTEDITASMALFLPFDELPEAFRWYITIRAARKFQDRVVGSSELHGFTREDEAHARALAEREDNEITRPSLAKGEAVTFISGWNVAATLRR